MKKIIASLFVSMLLIGSTGLLGFVKTALATEPLTITGWVQHNNEVGVLVDSRYIKVEAWEKDALFDDKIAEGYTDNTGHFAFTHDTNGNPILNEDSDLFESGTRDIYIKFYVENEAARVSGDLVGDVLGITYWGETDTDYDVTGPVWYAHITRTTDTRSPAMGIPALIKADRDWLSSITGGWTRDQLGVLYPDDDWPNFWPVIWTYAVMRIPDNWADDADTISHEYGHSVHFSARGSNLPDRMPVPTGEEDPRDGTPNAGQGAHWIFSESSGGFALTEGWAEFFEGARHGLSWDLSLETNDYWMGADGNYDSGPNTDGTTGEIVEGAFASILWDLYDGANDDGVSGGFSNLWTVFLTDDPDRIWSSSANDDFYHYWTNRFGQTRAVDEIFIDHGIPVIDDSYDSGTGNDGSATASNLGTIDISKRVEDLICIDIDWYAFTTSIQGNVDSEVAIEFDKSRGDLDLFVYRSDDTLVGTGVAFAGGKRLSLNGENPNTFKIKVVGTGDNPATPGIYEGDFSPNYDLKISLRWRSGGPDSFGYTFIDSNKLGGPSYDWIEISGTGTEVLPSSDDSWVGNISLGFFFNYYGTDYSHLAIGNNGLLFSGVGTSQYVNQPITQTPTIHGLIAPFWDDIVTWGSAGAIYYETRGTAPNRKFVVEWYDNQHYYSSTSGITFEAILYEGTNNILFQYKDVDFGTVYGAVGGDNPPYDNGGSATVGIEDPTGNIGLQYSFNDQVITPGLAILFKFPAFAGTNMYLSMNAPVSMDRGNTMTYTLHYNDFGDVEASNVVLQATLSTNVDFVSASDGGTYDPATRRVTWNIGTVPAFPSGRGSRTVTVTLPGSVPIGTIIQATASITTSTLETRYDDNTASAQTTVTGSSLPPNVGVGPILGNPGGTPSVYWTTPITFTYYDAVAIGVDIRIHLNDGGPDITGSMTGGPPTWTYTVTFYPRTGHATVTYIVHYPSGDSQVNFNIYVDPAGYVYDVVTLERISGANVWLQRPDGQGDWENVPTGQTPPIMQPDVNPQITGADGQYQWDVLEGSYRVHVEAPGYYPADSIVVTVPPPVTDLHVGLTPLPPPADGIPPTTTLTIGNPKYIDPSGNIYVTSATPFTLTAEDNPGGMGVASISYRIYNSTYDSGWLEYSAPFYLTGLSDSEYSIDYYSTDNIGNTEPTNTATVILDNTPPSTQLTIDYDGLWHTKNFINLTATDNFSGVAETYYKINDGPTKTVSVDGQALITSEGANNKLEYWSIDNAGNEELPHKILTGIKFDKTAPTGSITINNDVTYTTSPSVTLNLTSTDTTSGVYQIRFSNDGVWDTEPWEVPSPTKTWALTPGDGTKIVYYQIKDNAGLVSITYSDTIILDTTPPTGSITIAQGAAYTNSLSVTLTMSADDTTSGVARMRFSHDNSTWTSWEPYSTSKAWTLTTGDGTKIVYVQFMDNAGLVSPSYQDTITLDATKPTANAGQDQTVNVGEAVSFDAGGSSDNVGIVSYEWNFGDGTTGTGKTTSHIYTSPGNYTVTLTVKDAAGNTATHSITVTVLPVEAFPLWIVGAVTALIAIAVAATLLWKRRKQSPTKG